MLAYLTATKPHVDPGVYNQGLRLYLDGAVKRPVSLLLDNWREYEVIEKPFPATVTLPLLHLTLSPQKFNQAYRALSQVVKCDCDWFLREGMCRHVVAVLAQLDQEFSASSIPKKTASLPSDLLDTIFSAQKVKTHRKWLETIDQLLSRDTGNYFYLDQISKTIKDEPEEHKDFLAALEKVLVPKIGYYREEKRVLRIGLESILIGKEVFYKFFAPLVEQMDEAHRQQFWTALWRYYWMGACEGYKERLIGDLRQLPKAQKQTILEKLQKEYSEQAEVWREFCFQAQHYAPLVAQKETLDELTLIRLTELVPDMRESTDLLLASHLRTWSDFLAAGQYREFLELIQTWAEKLGTSEVFIETINYILANHKNKRSLVAKLKRFI